MTRRQDGKLVGIEEKENRGEDPSGPVVDDPRPASEVLADVGDDDLGDHELGVADEAATLPPPRPIMTGAVLVDLADQYGFTTRYALELCRIGEIDAYDGSASHLLPDEVEAFHRLAQAYPEPEDEEPELQSPDGVDDSAVAMAWKKNRKEIGEWQRLEPYADEPPRPPRLNTTGVWALVWALFVLVASFFGFLLGAILAAVISIALALKARITSRQDGNLRHTWIANLAIVLSIVGVVVLGVIVFTTLNGTLKRTPGQAVVDTFTGEETRYYTALKLGECFNVPDSVLLGQSQFEDVTIADCSGEHDVEVFAELEKFGIADVDEANWPGVDPLLSYMLPECEVQFEAYAGVPFDEGELDVVAMFPPEDEWKRGARRLLCGVTSEDRQPRTGSVRPA